MRIGIGSDHAGFAYKEKVKMFLAELGHTVVDFGTTSDAAVDYPPTFVRWRSLSLPETSSGASYWVALGMVKRLWRTASPVCAAPSAGMSSLPD